MNIKKEFLYDPFVEVSASQIGISKWEWTTIASDDQEKAKEIMKRERFDVLPIVNKDGTFNSYFVTQQWNEYERLNKLTIKEAQKVYYRFTFCDLIRKFKDEESHYYFLTDYNEIVGLVSYVNLNCQLVYNYLYFLIADIERSTSNILRKHISQEKVILLFEGSNDQHLRDLVKKFKNDVYQNNDDDIFQKFYLQTIGICIKQFINELPENYKKLAGFSKKFGPQGLHNLIRNKIMHPVKSVLSDRKSISQIDEFLTDYKEIKSIVSMKVDSK